MPLYEYECESCSRRFERIQKFSDPPAAECPHCGGPVRKLMSSPAIQFKGSGFYITDYARSGKGGESGASGKSGSDEKSSSKESGAGTSEKADKADKSESTSSSTSSSKTESAPAAPSKPTSGGKE